VGFTKYSNQGAKEADMETPSQTKRIDDEDVCQERIELETSNLSWDEKLLPNKIMFVKYMTKS
jgi:hypothetical protein